MDHYRLVITPPPFRRSAKSRTNPDLAGLIALGPAWLTVCLAGDPTLPAASLFLFVGSMAGVLGRRWLTGENWLSLGYAAWLSSMLMLFLVPTGLNLWLAGTSAGLGFILAGLLRGGPGGAIPAALWGGIIMAGFNSAPPVDQEYSYLACASPSQWYGLVQNSWLILGGIGLWVAGGRGRIRVWAMLAASGLAALAGGLYFFPEDADTVISWSRWSHLLVSCLFLTSQIKPWPVRSWADWGLSVACGLALGWTWGGREGLVFLAAAALAAPGLDDLTSSPPFGA